VDYKIERTSDNVAEFHLDRLRELGDLRVKKEKRKERKTSAVKHKTAGNYRSGRPDNLSLWDIIK